jgi:hypothetical protein
VLATAGVMWRLPVSMRLGSLRRGLAFHTLAPELVAENLEPGVSP